MGFFWGSFLLDFVGIKKRAALSGGGYSIAKNTLKTKQKDIAYSAQRTGKNNNGRACKSTHRPLYPPFITVIPQGCFPGEQAPGCGDKIDPARHYPFQDAGCQKKVIGVRLYARLPRTTVRGADSPPLCAKDSIPAFRQEKVLSDQLVSVHQQSYLPPHNPLS